MVNIKSYKDGDRLILVVENCKGDTAVKVNAFLSSLMLDSEPQEVSHIAPMQIKEEKAPDISDLDEVKGEAFDTPPSKEDTESSLLLTGAYKGLSIKDAIAKDGVRAAATLIATKDSVISDNEKDNMVVICKETLRTDLYIRNMDMFDRSVFADFISVYEPLIKEGISQIINRAGYNSIDDLINFAPDHLLENAQEALIDGLMENL